MGFSEDVDAFARNMPRRRVRLLSGLGLGLIFCVDASATLCLRDPDIILLLVLRVAAMCLLGGLAVAVGSPQSSSVQIASLNEPLIPSTAKDVQGQTKRCKKLAPRRQVASAISVSCLLVCSSAAQFFVGLKALRFPGAERWQVVCFALMVLCINGESWFVERLVHVLTAEEGFLVPALHRHRLLLAKRAGAVCDMCEVKSEQMYFCSQCDFDVCPKCFARRDTSQAEGMLRGDRGVKDYHITRSTAQYLRQTWALIVAPNLLLITGALACLGLNSVAGLYLPSLQGELFDTMFVAHSVCRAGSDPESDSGSDTCEVLQQVGLPYVVSSRR
jgi:hypothetical protein